jgi:hypothetical protein
MRSFVRALAIGALLAAVSCACPAKKKPEGPEGKGGGGGGTTEGGGGGGGGGPGPTAAPDAGAPASALPDKAGMPCDENGCAPPFTCVSYYGIAGPKGPQFRSCEVPCPAADSKCPAGTKCTTIADGPGAVCR